MPRKRARKKAARPAKKTARRTAAPRSREKGLPESNFYYIPIGIVLVLALFAMWLMLAPKDVPVDVDRNACGSRGLACCGGNLCGDGLACDGGICVPTRTINIEGLILGQNSVGLAGIKVFDENFLVGVTDENGAIDFSQGDSYNNFLQSSFGYRCDLSRDTLITCEVPRDSQDTASMIAERFSLA